MSQDLTITEAINRGTMYSTVKDNSLDGKKTVFNAVNAAKSLSEALADSKGELILSVSNIIVHNAEIATENGEIDTLPRVILITDTDEAYAAVSVGLLNSVRNILGILGDPSTWGEPIDFQVVEKRSRQGFRFLTLEIA